MTKQFFYKFFGAIVKFLFPYKVEYKGNIPEGNIVICANHISYIDFFFVRAAVGKDPSFMGKKEIYNSKILGYFAKIINIIPVNREGNDVNAIKMSLKVLKDGGALGIFPEGTRKHKNPDGKVHNGAAMLAFKTNSPIVPIKLSTKNDKVFIFKKTTVTVGEPILVQTKDYEEETKKIMEAIYSL